MIRLFGDDVVIHKQWCKGAKKSEEDGGKRKWRGAVPWRLEYLSHVGEYQVKILLFKTVFLSFAGFPLPR